MSYWNGKDFLRFLSKSFFNNRGTNYRLTAKRLGLLLLALLIYLPAEFLIWSSLYLDELLFPAYRQIQIHQPVFIIGNPRSGTTFLQRLLARDSHNFLSMQTWEIFLAPSILMRRILRWGVRTARSLGLSISRGVGRLENIWKDNDPIHRLKLRLPEEDEYLFIHIFSTLKIWSYLAMEEEAERYIYFDEMLPAADQERMMNFYESCLQRHLFSSHNKKRHYLSKNPNFSPAVETLLDRFPDAKFIYLIRSPLKAIPSHINLKEKEWQLLGSPLERYACRDFIIRTSEHWYQYPLERLADLPQDQRVVIRFDDLVSDARATVAGIYHCLGMELSPAFLELLELESRSARNYQRRHQYSIQEMGIDPRDLQERFAGLLNDFQLRK